VTTCRIVFGASLYGVVAIITTVLLGNEISESTIRNWHPRK
jgi:hypothetical protein